MSQTSYLQMVNEPGLAFRGHLNETLAALNTDFQGDTAPTTTVAYMTWLDTSTTPSTLRRRNSANTGWDVADPLKDDLANVSDATKGSAKVGMFPSGTVADRLNGVVTLVQFTSGTVADRIDAAISHLATLGGGTLRLTEDIALDRKVTTSQSNITIDLNGHSITWAGAGADNLYQGALQFVGQLTGTVGTVTSNSSEYSNAITLADASAFSVGDVIYIDSASTTSPGLYLNILAKITSKSGNTLYTDVVSRLPITASEGVTVTKVNPASNCWVVNGKILGGAGQSSRANGMGATYFTYSIDSGVRNLKVAGFWFKGVKTFICNSVSCSNIEVSNPAATGGGEGYGVQYEYTYNSNIYCPKGLGVRHLVDHTASSGCETYDGISIGSTDAAYNLHSAYEYDIGYTNCRSFGASSNDFALGSTGTGFSDYTDKIRLNSCLGKNSVSDSIKFASKGKGLEINGGEFNPLTSSVAYSLLTSMSDVKADQVDFIGGVQVATGGLLPTDGFVRIDNSRVAKQQNSRSILLGVGAVININDSEVVGQITLGNNSKVKWGGGTWYAQNTSDELVTNSPTGQNGQEIELVNVKISTSAIFKAAGYTLNASRLIFNGVEFDSGSHPIYAYGATTSLINGCRGAVRLYVSGSNVSDLAILNPRLSGLSDGSRILQVASYTGRITIIGGSLDAVARTNNCIDLSDVGNAISSLIVSNVQITGIPTIPDARVVRCNITGIMGDSSSNTLPTAGANKIVTNNIFY